MAEVYWHSYKVTKEDRQKIKGHKPAVVWFTGLSGSGKSTLANELEYVLNKLGVHTFLLDGDNIRHGLNADLGFSPKDREENIRRIGEVAKLFVEAGLIVLVAFISPYRKDRNRARSLVSSKEFIEVCVKCPLKIAEERDTKGLYKKARAGVIKDFTGISAPYEEPVNPDIVIETDKLSVQASVGKLIDYLARKNIIKRRY